MDFKSATSQKKSNLFLFSSLRPFAPRQPPPFPYLPCTKTRTTNPLYIPTDIDPVGFSPCLVPVPRATFRKIILYGPGQRSTHAAPPNPAAAANLPCTFRQLFHLPCTFRPLLHLPCTFRHLFHLPCTFRHLFHLPCTFRPLLHLPYTTYPVLFDNFSTYPVLFDHFCTYPVPPTLYFSTTFAPTLYHLPCTFRHLFHLPCTFRPLFHLPYTTYPVLFDNFSTYPVPPTCTQPTTPPAPSTSPVLFANFFTYPVPFDNFLNLPAFSTCIRPTLYLSTPNLLNLPARSLLLHLLLPPRLCHLPCTFSPALPASPFSFRHPHLKTRPCRLQVQDLYDLPCTSRVPHLQLPPHCLTHDPPARQRPRPPAIRREI